MDQVSYGTIRIIANGISGFKNVSVGQLMAESPLANLEKKNDKD